MATLNSVRNILQAFEANNHHIHQVKNTMITVRSIEPQPANKECSIMVEEMLSPENIYTPDLLHATSPIYRIIRDYLVVKGREFEHVGRRVYLGLSKTICTDPTDQDQAQQLVEAFQAQPHNPNIRGNGENRHVPNQEHKKRNLPHHFSNRFREEEHFSETIGQDITVYGQNFSDAKRDFELSDKQKLKYFHNLYDEQSGITVNTCNCRPVRSTTQY